MSNTKPLLLFTQSAVARARIWLPYQLQRVRFCLHSQLLRVRFWSTSQLFHVRFCIHCQRWRGRFCLHYQLQCLRFCLQIQLLGVRFCFSCWACAIVDIVKTLITLHLLTEDFQVKSRRISLQSTSSWKIQLDMHTRVYVYKHHKLLYFHWQLALRK